MLTQMIQTFAPDGHSAGHATVQGRFDGSKREHAVAAERAGRDAERHDNSHDFDDGLVHSHSWASTSYSR